MIYAGTGQRADRAEEYIRGLLANQCMPTLLKAKPSVLVTVNKALIGNTNRFFALLGEYLSCFECNYLPLQETCGRIYLLLYYEPLLRQALEVKQRQNFLASCGYGKYIQDGEYSAGSEYQEYSEYGGGGDGNGGRVLLEGALMRLGYRYHSYWEADDFPHEIGIFLGYPLADVTGFIKNKGRNYLLCGMWKVYRQEETAATAFQYYRRMKEQAVRRLERRNDLNIPDFWYAEERTYLKGLLDY